MAPQSVSSGNTAPVPSMDDNKTGSSLDLVVEEEEEEKREMQR